MQHIHFCGSPQGKTDFVGGSGGDEWDTARELEKKYEFKVILALEHSGTFRTFFKNIQWFSDEISEIKKADSSVIDKTIQVFRDTQRLKSRVFVPMGH